MNTVHFKKYIPKELASKASGNQDSNQIIRDLERLDIQLCPEMQCAEGCSVETIWHLGIDFQVKKQRSFSFWNISWNLKRKKPFPTISNHRNDCELMQIPSEMRVYTKYSGHKTLERLSKQQLARRKSSEHHAGHFGRRDCVVFSC